MIKILPSVILLTGLLGCSRTERSQSVVSADSSEMEGIDSAHAAQIMMDDYEASLIYSDSDSDSLLLDKSDLSKLVSLFKSKGSRVQEKVYEGGDCGGKFTRLVFNGDTLTIDKYSCGDYGFGNSQYLTNNDSLKLVRNYKMEWSAQPDSIEFSVSEKIYEFGLKKVTISERMKIINDWRNFDFHNVPFVTTTSDGQIDYLNLKKEQRQLVNGEELE